MPAGVGSSAMPTLGGPYDHEDLHQQRRAPRMMQTYTRAHRLRIGAWLMPISATTNADQQPNTPSTARSESRREQGALQQHGQRIHHEGEGRTWQGWVRNPECRDHTQIRPRKKADSRESARLYGLGAGWPRGRATLPAYFAALVTSEPNHLVHQLHQRAVLAEVFQRLVDGLGELGLSLRNGTATSVLALSTTAPGSSGRLAFLIR